jgi:hypothetical protein
MSKISDKPLTLAPGPIPIKSKIEAGPERRGAVRYPFTAAADVVELRSQARVAGRSSDLGLGGCYIDVLSPFAVGSVVRVCLEREQSVFEAVATVSYSQQSMGMGLAFTEVKTQHQAVLRAWVAELSGEGLPELDAAAVESDSGMPSTVLHLQQVLNELINLMVRKKIINETEGAALLRQIFR